MKILKLLAVCLVLINYSVFVYASTTAYSKNLVTNQENTVMYEKYLKNTVEKNDKMNIVSEDQMKTVRNLIFICFGLFIGTSIDTFNLSIYL